LTAIEAPLLARVKKAFSVQLPFTKRPVVPSTLNRREERELKAER
jgi:hypothetical protein